MPQGEGEITLNQSQIRRKDQILQELAFYDDAHKGTLPQIDFDIKAAAGVTTVGAFFTFGLSLAVGGSTLIALLNTRERLLKEYEALKAELREIQGTDSEATYQPSKEIKELINPKRYGRALGEVGIFAKSTVSSAMSFGKDMFQGTKRGGEEQHEATPDEHSPGSPTASN